jgi:hypothetical protein
MRCRLSSRVRKQRLFHVLAAAWTLCCVVSAEDSHYPTLLSITGAATMQNYSLAGTGFNAELPYNSGLAYTLLASKYLNGDWGIWSKFSKQDTVLRDLPGVTPTSVSFQQWQASVGAVHLFDLEGWASTLQLILGYSVQASRAQVTSPNAVIASNYAIGPLVGLCWRQSLDGYRLFSQLDFFMPNWFREDGGSTTGSYLSAYRATLQLEAGIPITPSIWVYSGLHLNFEKQNFIGTGSRGVTDGSQSLFNFAFPLRVEVVF